MKEIDRRYLFVSLRNECVREIDRQKRVLRMSESDPLELIQGPFLGTASLERGAEQAKIDERLAERLRHLPPRRRAVIQARAHGLSYAEIATRLGISMKTVCSHIQKARAISKREGEATTN
ncbi:MAG: RNA polymerase sigma factor [Longimicrobiales bacterium]